MKNKQKQAKRAAAKRKKDLRKELGLKPNDFRYVVVRALDGTTLQVPLDAKGEPVTTPNIVLDLAKYKGVKTLPPVPEEFTMLDVTDEYFGPNGPWDGSD